MKVTSFRFDLRVAPDDSAGVLRGLQAKLDAIKGINSVSSTELGGIVDLCVSASFVDAEDAKKLHRKVMNTLMACEGVTILQVKTMLTDVF